jgi:thioredoxin 1
MTTVIDSPQALADLVSKQEGTVLVDFWAAWCGPCRMLAKEFPAVQAEFGDKLTIAKVNVDEQQELAQHFQVASIPMMMVFKDGKPVKKLIGAQPASKLINELEPFVS